LATQATTRVEEPITPGPPPLCLDEDFRNVFQPGQIITLRKGRGKPIQCKVEAVNKKRVRLVGKGWISRAEILRGLVTTETGEREHALDSLLVQVPPVETGELSNSPALQVSKVGELMTRATEDDPTDSFASEIRGITYEAPAFENAEQFRTAFEEAEHGAHDAAKKKFKAEADMILYVAQVQSYLSERGANAHLRKAAGLKAGFQEWYEAFRAEYDLEYAFKTVQQKIAELRGGCKNCGRLNDRHKQSCVLYRKLIDRAEPEEKKDGAGNNGNRLNTKEAGNAFYTDRYWEMVTLFANAPLDADPQQIFATMQAEAIKAHQELPPELAKKIKIPKLVELPPKPDPEAERYKETLARLTQNHKNHVCALGNQLAGMVIGGESYMSEKTVKLAEKIVDLYQQSRQPGFFGEQAKLHMHPIVVGEKQGKKPKLSNSQRQPSTEPEKPFPADSLKRALHIRTGAQARWDTLCENGATDERIREQIGLEFGIKGSYGVPDSPEGYEYAGGKNPQFSANGTTLKGRILVAKVRELLAIPESKIEVEKAKT
jgi:hypothetical protein